MDSLIIRMGNWSHRQHSASRARRKGLIAWLLAMIAVFALASASWSQGTPPELLVEEETDNPEDVDKTDRDKDDQDKDDQDKDKKDKDKATFSNPTTSSPIALSADNTLLWVVNPSDDSVSVIRTDTKHVLAKITVGKEPQSVALDPRNRFAYVANAASNNVSVIRIHNPKPDRFKAALIKQLLTGAEPWNVTVSPDGRRVFVANSSQDTITVINARARRIIGHVDLRQSVCNDPDRYRHFQPRGLAVTEDSKRLFVTRFLSFTKQGGVQAEDLGKEGIVCLLKIDTHSHRIGDYKPVKAIPLGAQPTGFLVDTPGPNNTVGDGVQDQTFAFPNQLQSIVIRGDQAYLPNIAASPTSPQIFNVTTQAFVNVLDGVNSDHPNDASTGKFLNLQLGARNPEANKRKLFFANPWGIVFTNGTGQGAAYAISAGSDLLVKLKVGADGKVEFTEDSDTTRYIDLNDPDDPLTSGDNAGKNPLGIVVDKAGATAYTMNNVSRNVSVVDLSQDKVVQTIRTTDLPPPGSKEEEILVGAEMFFSSRGYFNPPPDGSSRRDRLASEGWQNCASCHFEGLTDGVIWSFGNGSRKSLAMNGTFNPRNRLEQKILNISPGRDEIEDFDLNIRNVSGPGPKAGQLDPDHGLIIPETPALTDIADFIAKANANRNQVTVTLPGSSTAVPAWNALREWIRFAIRTPNAPLNSTQVVGGVSLDKIAGGRNLFVTQQCQTCHRGDQWTISKKDFVSPPATTEIATEVAGANPPPGGSPAPPVGITPVGAQFLFRFVRDIGSFNLGVLGAGNLLGNNIGGIELANSVVNAAGVAQPQLLALGKDHNLDKRGEGFNVPMILGIHNLPPYLHNGACETLLCVVSDKNHRTANGKLPDVIGNDQSLQEMLAAFLESIDDLTLPFQ
ncbi:MAG: YncE family protein [Nitrospira sp.]|nr:YncE family protein [Nitrospira sp.]